MSRLISIHEAADFYDIRSPGLGYVFIDEIQRAIGKISEFPAAAVSVQGRVRKRPITKFPYSVIYSVRPEEIRILAIAHQKRRPFYWQGRR